VSELEKLLRLQKREDENETQAWKAAISTQDFTPCLQLIEAALDAILELIDVAKDETEAQLARLHIAARVWNAVAAALCLAKRGYIQQSFMAQRDLLEHGWLAEYFNYVPESIERWRTCSDKARRSEFTPKAIRAKLDKRDQVNSNRRGKIYSYLSKYAAHPDPRAFRMICLTTGVQVGPFWDEARFRSCLMLLAFWTALSAAQVCKLIPAHGTSKSAVAHFLEMARSWIETYGPVINKWVSELTT